MVLYSSCFAHDNGYGAVSSLVALKITPKVPLLNNGYISVLFYSLQQRITSVSSNYITDHSQISNQGQNPQSGTGGAAKERDVICSFSNAIVDAGRLGVADIGWGDVVGDRGVRSGEGE
ncbi:hypothetical protein CMV_025683 [Castanea mollissima]|uniref:Uncharacterized protein n=1 Tax=Castanea mollissima TaxID=60419 RepID=A0A8J4VGG5_9ROSI|nr:hypothetical protein CMV_025683 [Castanea mollissima]